MWWLLVWSSKNMYYVRVSEWSYENPINPIMHSFLDATSCRRLTTGLRELCSNSPTSNHFHVSMSPTLTLRKGFSRSEVVLGGDSFYAMFTWTQSTKMKISSRTTAMMRNHLLNTAATILVRLKILEIQFFWTLRSHSSKPLPPIATILPYSSSAQQVLTGKPHDSIRKPIIAILTLNSDI